MPIESAHIHFPIPYFIEIVTFLITVVIITPVCRRLKISPIIGFLCIGALIGPHSFALIADTENVQHLAELGVILLLFSIGLELSFERLRSHASQILGLGSCHFLLCAAVISVTAWKWGNNLESSIVLGLCLALSSTAVVVQLLDEKKEMGTTHGRSAFSVLLFQDLMVVPILIIVSIFGGQEQQSVTSVILTALLKAGIAIAAIVFVGRYIMHYLFKVATNTHALDVFMAATLLVVLCTSAITGFAGLSVALGAFLAGLLLAETEFRHQIEVTITPFKGLFLGLFFMGVGLNIDFVLAFERGYWVILSVFGLILIKTCLGLLASLIFRLKKSDAIRVSLLLAESGEFAFLVIGQASVTYSILSIEVAQFMVVVAGVSMILTPFLAFLGKFIVEKCFKDLSDIKSQSPTTEFNLSANSEFVRHDHIVIIGFGRVGQSVAEILDRESIHYVAIEKDISIVKNCSTKSVYCADAADMKMLDFLSLNHALCVLVTMDNSKSVSETLKNIRSKWTDLSVIVRAKDIHDSTFLLSQGATQAIPELAEYGLQMASHVLQNSRYSREEAEACIEIERQRATYL